MEFDKSKVYTSLNANELKIGSKVICANNIDSLKCKVRDDYDVVEIKEILDESYERRFQIHRGVYPFVYLVSEPEEKKLKWTDLKLGDVIRRKGGLREGIVTLIDRDDETLMHIYIGQWLSSTDLEIWEKVE